MDKKISKKYIISLLVTVFGLVALVSSTSYAILRGTSTDSNTHIVRVGSVEIELTEKYNTMETNFSIMKDSEGLMQEITYDFTITNIGSVPAKYDLKLMNTAPNGQTALSSEYLRIGLQVNGREMGPMGLSNVNNVIDSNTINNGEVIRYKMRVWLDKNKKTQIEQNKDKKAYLSLKVEARQADYAPTTYVYRYGTAFSANNAPLNPGSYTGYCLVYGNQTSTSNHNNNDLIPKLLAMSADDNSCTDDNYGFLTESACNSTITNKNLTEYQCIAGNWTVPSSVSTTDDPSSLNKQFYLKYDIDKQSVINGSYVCYVLNNEEYCLKGGDGIYNSTLNFVASSSYVANKQILDFSFGSSYCREYDADSQNANYHCFKDTLSITVGLSGYINVGNINGDTITSHCTIWDRGNSQCS